MFVGPWLVMACMAQSPDATVAEAAPLAQGVYVLAGSVNTGVIVRDGSALLIDCGEEATPERLAALGADRVEMICMTQHRRPNAMGAYRFVEEQGAQIVVSQRDRVWFEGADAHWNDWRNRWHIYHMQPGPQVLPRSMAVDRTVSGGDAIEWRGVSLQVVETPGATEGAVSYVAEVDGKRIAFIGDAMCGPGRIPDLYSLQKGVMGVGDYHGFLGMREPLLGSLQRLVAAEPDVAVPSHGVAFEEVAAGAALLTERLGALYRNYASISALHHYIPALFEDVADDPARMAAAQQLDSPPWVRRLGFTSFAVMSDAGDALLVDCGHDSVLDRLDEWQRDGTLRSVDACWVTHYHDDHVDSLYRLATRNCPIITDARMAEVLERPNRYFLPCVSPTPVPVARRTQDGESWMWREFQLTAFHFPGQTLYHGGLLVEKDGLRVFFAGDSGAPTGLDDYCAPNRTFLGAGRGSRRCLEIWRTVKPDRIYNQHQERPFRFTDEQLDYMDRVLAEREDLTTAVTPWEDANFAIDEHWLRAYPYEQEAAPGDRITVQIQLTNHAASAAPVAVRPTPPPGWSWDEGSSRAALEAPPRTDGWVGAGATHPDAVLSLSIGVPADAAPGLYVVPLSVDFGDRRLSAFRHALVRVR